MIILQWKPKIFAKRNQVYLERQIRDIWQEDQVYFPSQIKDIWQGELGIFAKPNQGYLVRKMKDSWLVQPRNLAKKT